MPLYRAPYGAIKLKKIPYMLKRHGRASYGAIKLKKKLACFKTPLKGFKKLHGTQFYGARVPEFFFLFKFSVCYNSIV